MSRATGGVEQNKARKIETVETVETVESTQQQSDSRC